MAIFNINLHQLSIIFGICGNIVSFMVYLAPIPTFCKIVKEKSTQGFQCIPYSVALFSAMLTLYYAIIKTNAFLLVTINTIGCVIESLYLIIYLIYATREAKIFTGKLLVLFNFAIYGAIIGCTLLFTVSSVRVTIVGWICAVFSVCVFAAPLGIIREVIRTKSVKYMPLPLSLALTICAVMWGLYGLAVGDFFIATPNVLGLAFGMTQIGLYLIYKEKMRLPKNMKPVQEMKVIEMNGEDQIVEIQIIDNQQEININGSDNFNLLGRVLGNSTIVPSDVYVTD